MDHSRQQPGVQFVLQERGGPAELRIKEPALLTDSLPSTVVSRAPVIRAISR